MKLRAVLIAFAICATPTFVTSARAQGAAEHIAIGDKDHMDAAASLKHYEAALAAEPNNYEALWKAAGAAVDAGYAVSDRTRQATLYKAAEQYARRAVQVNAGDAEGHFELARAIGRNAQTMGSRDKVKYAAEVRSHALDALKIDPRHAGAMHVMGEWNAEIMRLSGVARFMAKNFLGGKIFESASWNDAQRYLEQAVAIEPNRIVHRIDLAQVYADRDNVAKAREQIEAIARMPATDPNDAKYKADAEALAQKLK
jgi:tetratricopeptide (TPR) repeat protein